MKFQLSYDRPAFAEYEACLNFPENEKADIPLRYISSNGIQQTRRTLCVNEPGFYRLIFQSHKPEAERLKTRVFNEILPQIRKTGKYSAAETRLEALEAKVDKLLDLAAENTELRDENLRFRRRYRFTPEDRQEILRLHEAGYKISDIKDKTQKGRTRIKRTIEEAAALKAQPELFADVARQGGAG